VVAARDRDQPPLPPPAGLGHGDLGLGQGTPWTNQWTWANCSGTAWIDELPLGHRTMLRAADPRGHFPVGCALEATNTPDHRRRFLHNLKNGGFAPQNGRVHREVAEKAINCFKACRFQASLFSPALHTPPRPQP
jgi:hypothetical protein